MNPLSHKTKRRVANVDCRQIRGLLPAYLDGELAQATRTEIEEHLATCPECRRIANDYRRDLQVLSYQLRAAPWQPVRQRPWEAAGAGGFRSWFGSIGHKLVAGTAMVALAALLVVGGLALKEMANGTNPNGNPQATQTNQIAAGGSATSTVTAGTSGWFPYGNVMIDKTMSALAAHNLVVKIDKPVMIDSKTVGHLDRLGVDRTLTILTLNEPKEQLESPAAELQLANGKTIRPFASTTVSTDTGLQSAYLFPGMPADSSQIKVELSYSSHPAPVAVPVKVNLSPVRQANLAAPLEIGQTLRQSDIQVKLGQLTRGIVVSTVTWQAIDGKSDTPVKLDMNDISAKSGNQDIQVIHSTMPAGSGSAGTSWLLNLPGNGTFSMRFAGAQVDQGGSPKNIDGSWAFTVNPTQLLAQAQASATAAAQATQSAVAASTPVATETVVATPEPSPTMTASPTPSPTSTVTTASGPTLPANLLYLAPSPDGTVALWSQPSDGTDARMLYHPDHDITNFWLVPGSKSVAVQMGNAGPVVLVNLDGTPTGAPTLPDGQAIVEYVPSPDGKLIAFIPADQQSIWVGVAGGGEMYQIDKTNGKVPQTIHDLTWAPTSDSLSYHLAQIEGPDRLVVTAPTNNGIIWQSTASVDSWAYSPDGKSIVFTSGNRVSVVTISNGNQVDVTPATLKKGNYALLNVTWRKDGRIGFVAHDDGSVYNRADLWLMQSDGSQAWRAHIDIGAAIGFTWAPTGDGFVTEAPAPGAGGDQSQNQSYQIYWYPKLGSNPVQVGQANELTTPQAKLDWLR